MTENTYPRVSERVKALFTDFIIIFLFMFISSYIFSLFDNIPDNARISAFVFIFFLYDPFFTSFFGGTIGHMNVGLRVKKDINEEKNISFLSAVLRYILKTFLGWISLLTVTSNNKGRAIHDIFAHSVVIYSKTSFDSNTYKPKD